MSEKRKARKGKKGSREKEGKNIVTKEDLKIKRGSINLLRKRQNKP